MAVNTLKTDLTRTSLVRKSLKLFFKRLFSNLANSINEAIIVEDALSTVPRSSSSQPFSIFYPWRFLPLSDRIKVFVEWFDIEAKNQIYRKWEDIIDKHIYNVVLSGIQDAYKQIVRTSKKGLPDSEFSAGIESATNANTTYTVINLDSTRDKLRQLKERSLSDLQGILEVISTQLYRLVMDALSISNSKEDLYSQIANKLTTIGVNRSFLMVDSEVVRWFTTGQLVLFTQSGISLVNPDVEINNGRICVTCNKINKLPPEQAWNLLPNHIGCRCKWVISN